MGCTYHSMVLKIELLEWHPKESRWIILIGLEFLLSSGMHIMTKLQCSLMLQEIYEKKADDARIILLDSPFIYCKLPSMDRQNDVCLLKYIYTFPPSPQFHK